MMSSEAQRRANAKYHKNNIASVACRMKKEKAEQFKAYCSAQGKTVNAVLTEFINSCIKENETG